MRNYIYILSAILLIGINSCIDEISLKVDSDNRKIAVDGLISDDPDTYEIKLSYTSVLGQGVDIVQDKIKGASVKVIDDLGNEVEFIETQDGTYSGFMAGVVGRSYFTEISIGETIIRSFPQTILPRIEIDTLTYAIETERYQNSDKQTFYKDEIVLKVNTTIDEGIERPYIRWRIDGEFQFVEDYPRATSKHTCYVPSTVDFNTLSIFDTRNLNGNFLFDQEIIRVPLDYRFVYNYCFHVKQYSITKEEYNYWENIRELSYVEGSLFDPPPGRIHGNMYNVNDQNDYIVGFFSVTSVSRKRYFVNRFDMDKKIDPPCTSWRQERPECRDCLKFTGSTWEQPDYWRK